MNDSSRSRRSLPAENKKPTFALQLPMKIHMGVCRECGARIAIAGGPKVGGYIIPAHHSADIAAATRGEMCPGGEQRPAELIPD